MSLVPTVILKCVKDGPGALGENPNGADAERGWWPMSSKLILWLFQWVAMMALGPMTLYQMNKLVRKLAPW